MIDRLGDAFITAWALYAVAMGLIGLGKGAVWTRARWKTYRERLHWRRVRRARRRAL